MKNRLDPALLNKTFTFDAYNELVKELIEQKRTTGPVQSELLAHYTKLNFQRTKRITKSLQLSREMIDLVQNLQSEMLWIVIAESWCGDVPQNLPYLNAISVSSKSIQLRIVLRDDNPEIMDQFLTNGSRAIPKLICLDPETYEVSGTWGPRPVGAEEIVQTLLRDPEITKDMRNEAVQRWYLKNKGQQLQSELSLIIKDWDTYLMQQKLTEIE